MVDMYKNRKVEVVYELCWGGICILLSEVLHRYYEGTGEPKIGGTVAHNRRVTAKFVFIINCNVLRKQRRETHNTASRFHSYIKVRDDPAVFVRANVGQ